MNAYERDDRHVTEDELRVIANHLSQSARESVTNAKARSITYSKKRRRMYLVIDQGLEYGTRKRVKAEIADAATIVFGHKTTLKVADYQIEFNNPWCFECGSDVGIEWHHVVPKSFGGLKTLPLCDHCHGIVTSDQDLSEIGKVIFAEIDRRARADAKFIDKVCQRHGGRFVTDDKLERVTNALVKYSREIETKAMIGGYRGSHSLDRRKIRDLIRTVPLPTKRPYTHAEKLEQTSVLEKRVEAA